MNIYDFITGTTREDREMQAARDIFQVKEHDGKLWLTHNGNLVLPCDMLKGEPMAVLGEIRQLYVSRNMNNKKTTTKTEG